MFDKKRLTDPAIIRIIKNEDYAEFLLKEAKESALNDNLVVIGYALKHRITREEQQYFKNFELFYEGIVNYAKHNYYYPQRNADTLNVQNFYYVSIKDTVLKIGIISGSIHSLFFSLAALPI